MAGNGANSADCKIIAAFLEEHDLPAGYQEQILRVHAPLADRLAQAASSRSRPAPLCVGICGPQGAGKSTLASSLAALIRARGPRAVVLSLDDFYLSRADRERMAEIVHPLFRTRGVPGTHNVSLILAVLAALAGSTPVRLPRFDKGNDDCAPSEAWPTIAAPLDVVILEGWCLGAQAQAPDALVQPVNELESVEDSEGEWRRYVNMMLETSYRRLFSKLDLLVFLRPPNFEAVFEMRKEQERKLACGHPGANRVMEDDQLRRFISHYERLTRHMLSQMPSSADVVIDIEPFRAQDQSR